jgi:hypothetical protein
MLAYNFGGVCDVSAGEKRRGMRREMRQHNTRWVRGGGDHHGASVAGEDGTGIASMELAATAATANCALGDAGGRTSLAGAEESSGI